MISLVTQKISPCVSYQQVFPQIPTTADRAYLKQEPDTFVPGSKAEPAEATNIGKPSFAGNFFNFKLFRKGPINAEQSAVILEPSQKRTTISQPPEINPHEFPVIYKY